MYISRLPDEVANDYPQLKQALLKRYNLTEEGYREKFRRCSPEKDESPEQFIFRISTYLNQWVKFSNSEQTYQGIKNLIVKEQFINSCPQDLSIYLQERAPSTIEELSKLSEKYLIAHKRTLADNKNKSTSANTIADFKCYKCNESGARAQAIQLHKAKIKCS